MRELAVTAAERVERGGAGASVWAQRYALCLAKASRCSLPGREKRAKRCRRTQQSWEEANLMSYVPVGVKRSYGYLRDTVWNWNNWKGVKFYADGHFDAPTDNCRGGPHATSPYNGFWQLDVIHNRNNAPLVHSLGSETEFLKRKQSYARRQALQSCGAEVTQKERDACISFMFLEEVRMLLMLLLLLLPMNSWCCSCCCSGARTDVSSAA